MNWVYVNYNLWIIKILLNLEKAINDYQIVPQTQLGIQAQTTIRNTTVERCAEQCYLEDGYFCRSFDFFMDRDECNLYKENIKDKPFVDLKLTKNQLCNHYSSKFFFLYFLFLKTHN